MYNETVRSLLQRLDDMRDGTRERSFFAAALLTACILIALVMLLTSSAGAGETLTRVRENGEVRCGVTEQLLGFSFRDEQGQWRGFNVDFCRAVAAAALGNAEKVRFTPLSAPNRFPSLLAGRIDLLAHTATWTFGREAGIGIDFPGIYFYDGQTFGVPTGLTQAKGIEDLSGKTICLEKGTTYGTNMEAVFKKRDIPYTPLVLDSKKELGDAFRAGQCQAVTAERSVLAALQTAVPNGAQKYTILPGVISKEPLAPAVRDGDEEWTKLVRWVLFALIEAEELGVTKSNVRALQRETDDPALQWFLNSCGQRGKALGLKTDWVADVISAVGNYGEIYERNFGAASGLNIERGMNRLWNQGGLLYAPPFQ
jgi:general L-amino acid transport system substrate-binding protein